MHWHSMFAGIPIQTLMTADTGYINIVAGAESRKTLLRGFTTVRDVGGAVWGLKAAIDAGHAEGPAHLAVRRHDHRHQRAWRFS